MISHAENDVDLKLSIGAVFLGLESEAFMPGGSYSSGRQTGWEYIRYFLALGM